MSTPAKVGALLVAIVGSFLAGSWWGRSDTPVASASGRKVLYWHDPMHPAYKSDKPGIAPDCGMQLEPVYADGHVSTEKPSSNAGTMQISADRQQLIGIRTEEVRSNTGASQTRVLGKVSMDETRVYKVNSTVDGWMREISPATTGSLVQKNEPLASYYAPEFLGAQQAYLYALGALDRFQATGKETPDQIRLTHANIQQAKDSLTTLGMNEIQTTEIAKTRVLSQKIQVYAPVSGFVVARNVSPGQRFEKGAEFYRIADLSHVWILADLFENDARMAQSVREATVLYKGQSFHAMVSNTPPIFDPNTRTLKLRLELDNPHYTLRPDMFVDVEFKVTLPPGITVPSDAVMDSGLRKTVFVDKGNGNFEPRQVDTGARIGDRVVVTSGLREGERIVVSGNFLIDSEAKFKLAASGLTQAATKDSVCGMDVEPSKAGDKKAEYKGKTYYFCSDSCKQKFQQSPEKYAPGK
jgi:Cu(I)/Ag(I) efflux system membrane fusion protein